MDKPYFNKHRNTYCDVETDDVPDGHSSLIATNFSVHTSADSYDDPDGTFLSSGPRPALRARGSAPAFFPSSHIQKRKDSFPLVSPTARCSSINDSGCETLGSILKPYMQGRIDSGCDSLGLDLNVLEIKDSLQEDIHPSTQPIQLREIHRTDSGLPFERENYRTDSGFAKDFQAPQTEHFRNTHVSLDGTCRSTFISEESGYHSCGSAQRSFPSVTDHFPSIPENEVCAKKQTVPRTNEPICLPEISRSILNEELFVQNEEGDTLSHYAIYTDNQELFNSIITKVMHYKWLNIQNNNQQTPLHLAVIQNQPHNVRRLVSWGASIDIRDRHGNTALHLACDRLRMECVMALTTHLERRDVKEVPYTVPFQRIPQNQDLLNYDGKTCLHLAAEKAYRPIEPHFQSEQKNYLPIVHHLLNKCGANINAQEGKAGETALHQAVQAGHVKLVEYLLLSRHIDVNSKRYDGRTAYQLAVGLGHTKIEKMLLRAGAHNYFETECSVEEDMEVESQPQEPTRSPKRLVLQSQDDEFAYDDIKIGGQLLST